MRQGGGTTKETVTARWKTGVTNWAQGCLVVCCLTSQKYVSISQGRICSDRWYEVGGMRYEVGGMR